MNGAVDMVTFDFRVFMDGIQCKHTSILIEAIALIAEYSHFALYGIKGA
jgi:hypothetical protein